jgi:hypothetical protein
MSQTWNIPAAATSSLDDLREAMNDALATLRSNNAGASEPASTTAGMFWFNSDTGDLMLRNAADTDWSTLFAGAGGGSVATNTPVLRRLSSAGFNGSTTSFTNLLPVEPNVTTNIVVLIQAGVGPLLMVGSSPGADEFCLSGTTNQDVTFGTAPGTGVDIYAVYVAA